ncbi:MAG: hypothetical protein M0Z38_01970 [Deltaproteobacteria bacterium]|nr:hypothetical protein [Deltaproteobacteria bacterium]
MRGRSRGWGGPVVAAAVLLMAGCSVNSTFVYKPGPPEAGTAKLPVKVVVLPFKDGTEDFTKRGSEWNPDTLMFNLAKGGIGGTTTALTPDLWAKAFADDMAASGSFRAVRFVYSPSEFVDEEFTIEGTVEKAYVVVTLLNSNEFALGLRALRMADNRLVWEKEVTRAWKIQPTLYDGCGRVQNQCRADRLHAELNRVMREMFAEARTDLAATLAALSGSGAGESGLPPAASTGEAPQGKGASSPPAPDSVEETIEKILKAK